MLKELSNDKVKVFEKILETKLKKLALTNRISSDLDAPRIIEAALNTPRSDSDETKNTSQTQRAELDEFKRLVLSVYKTYIGIFGEFIFNNDKTLKKEIEYILKKTRIHKDITPFYYWKHLAFFVLIYGIFITTFIIFFDKLAQLTVIYKVMICTIAIIIFFVLGSIIFIYLQSYWSLPKKTVADSSLLFKKMSIDAESVADIAHELGHRIHSKFIKHHYGNSKDFDEGFAELMAGVILENFGKEPTDYWDYNIKKPSDSDSANKASFLFPHYSKKSSEKILVDPEEDEFISLPDPYIATNEYNRVRYSLIQFIDIKKGFVPLEVHKRIFPAKKTETQSEEVEQLTAFIEKVKNLTLKDIAREMIKQMEQYGTEWKLAYFMALHSLGLDILVPINAGRQTNNAMTIRPAIRKKRLAPNHTTPISTSA